MEYFISAFFGMIVGIFVYHKSVEDDIASQRKRFEQAKRLPSNKDLEFVLRTIGRRGYKIGAFFYGFLVFVAMSLFFEMYL